MDTLAAPPPQIMERGLAQKGADLSDATLDRLTVMEVAYRAGRRGGLLSEQ